MSKYSQLHLILSYEMKTLTKSTGKEDYVSLCIGGKKPKKPKKLCSNSKRKEENQNDIFLTPYY